MPRDTLIKGQKKGRPPIVVIGQSTMEGRMSTLLRIRPSVVEHVKSVSIGPLYLLIEHALMEMVRRAEAGEEIMLYAEDMQPTPEDRDLLDSARKQAAVRQKAIKALKPEAV